jgi:serine/threonine protein kinase
MAAAEDHDERTVVKPAQVVDQAGLRVRDAQAEHAAHAAHADDGHALPIGTRLDEFEITHRIGEGGFSIVYLVWDHSLERRVALKEYLPMSIAARGVDTAVRPRSDKHRETFSAGLKSFINEAKLLAQFDHPSLVKVYRFWEANGTAYMIMPFYEGVTLRDIVRGMTAPPDEAWLLEMLAPLTQALLVIHRQQCFHRDIAPDNIILLADTGRPLLLDFGAARRVIGDMTQALTVILKPGYAPVEQYDENPGMKQGAWTDVYALAAVLHWAIAGKTPPPAVGRMMHETYTPLAHNAVAAARYSQSFLQAIDQALAVMPGQRTPSIDRFGQGLGVPASAYEASEDGLVADGLPPTSSRASSKLGTSPGPGSSDSSRGQAPASGPIFKRVATAVSAASRAPLAQAAAPATDPANAAALALAAAHSAQSTPSTQAVNAPPKPAVMLLATAVAAMIVATAGLWWSRQNEAPVPANQAAASAAGSEPTLAQNPAAAAMATPAPNVPSAPAPPTAGPPVTPPTTSPVTSPATPLATPPVTPPVTLPPPEPTPVVAAPLPATPRAQVAPASAALNTELGASPAESASTPAPLRKPANTKGERRSTESTAAAECARIMQRLSLGESSADLIDRMKTLGCR